MVRRMEPVGAARMLNQAEGSQEEQLRVACDWIEQIGFG